MVNGKVRESESPTKCTEKIFGLGITDFVFQELMKSYLIFGYISVKVPCLRKSYLVD